MSRRDRQRRDSWLIIQIVGHLFALILALALIISYCQHLLSLS